MITEELLLELGFYRTDVSAEESGAEALNAEQKLFMTIITKFPENNYVDKNGNHHFHNFWSQENLGGITEIRKYNHTEVQEAYKFISENGARFYKDLVA